MHDSPTLHNLLPKTQPSVTCIFFITSMLMNSWQISDSCFHSFTFADGNILAYLKKRSWRWTLFENLAQKMLCISFNISCIICKWKTWDQFKPGAQLGYSETFSMHSFYVLHLVRALLHFVITWSSQFSSQVGFWDKVLEQVREYYFKLELELDSQGSGGITIPGGIQKRWMWQWGIWWTRQCWVRGWTWS